MGHKEQKQKETIYFLEWLAYESGFTENQILENMKPENQKWIRATPDESINKFLETTSKINFCSKIFKWKDSFLKPNYYFWKNINYKWEKISDSDKYNIEFSRYPIKNWKIIELPKKVKVKSKLKI